MIRGIHGMFYSADAEASHAFLRDALRLPFTDVGGGWLIFDLPEGDLGCHPVDDGGEAGTHDVSFYCDDIHGTVAELAARGVVFTHPVEDHGFGLVTHFEIPGGIAAQLYEPRYQKRATTAAAPPTSPRPPFIVSTADVAERAHSYPNSDEKMGPNRRVGHAAGLLRMGINVQTLPPGTRSSWPHAEEDEEEFVFLLEGEVDCWVDGHLHRMVAGDLAAFPAGTGICHTFINNGDRPARLLVGGEAAKSDSRIYYPLNPGRRGDMTWSQWWEDVPARPLGPHDGLPDARRGGEGGGE
jgi:uncharacterized cupin superfamily protein